MIGIRDKDVPQVLQMKATLMLEEAIQSIITANYHCQTQSEISKSSRQAEATIVVEQGSYDNKRCVKPVVDMDIGPVSTQAATLPKQLLW